MFDVRVFGNDEISRPTPSSVAGGNWTYMSIGPFLFVMYTLRRLYVLVHRALLVCRRRFRGMCSIPFGDNSRETLDYNCRQTCTHTVRAPHHETTPHLSGRHSVLVHVYVISFGGVQFVMGKGKWEASQVRRNPSRFGKTHREVLRHAFGKSKSAYKLS